MQVNQAERIVAASYERVSTGPQARHGFSLTSQHRSGEEFAADNGWNLPDNLRFRDTQSGVLWELPGLTAMLEAARSGAFSILLVPDLDRFARDLVKARVLEEQLAKYGVQVIYQRVPVDNSPEGRLLKTQLFAFAEYEREKTLLRTMMGRREKALSGRVVGTGAAPYGYRFSRETLHNGRQRTNGLEPDPDTAPIAARIFHELRTTSTLDVCQSLMDDGIPGPTGGRWTQRTINRIGCDPVYAGVWKFGKKGQRVNIDSDIGISVPVPAIVSRAEWEAVQDALFRRKTVRKGRMPIDQDPYLLRGKLECGHCGSLLRTTPNHETRYYGCGRHRRRIADEHGHEQCVLPDVYATHLEAELWRVLTTTLLDRDFLEFGIQEARERHHEMDRLRIDRLKTIDTQIVRERKRLDGIVLRLIDGDGNSEMVASLERTQREIVTHLERMVTERALLAVTKAEGLTPDDAEAIAAVATEIRAGIEHATDADRRALYDLLGIRGVVFIDPDGVKMGRKHRYRVEWSAAIPLLHASSRFKKPVMQ
ncbi:recombinase family protein [soil metagenome]